MGKEIRSVSFSGDGESLAVGFRDGQISFVRFAEKKLTDVSKTRERNAAITCVRQVLSASPILILTRITSRFSPNRQFLAASSENCCIDFFDIQQKKFTRVGYVTHIEDAVNQVDWSVDSKYVRVNTILVKERTGDS